MTPQGISALRSAQSAIDAVLRVAFSGPQAQIAMHPGSQLTNVCHLSPTDQVHNTGVLMFTLRVVGTGEAGVVEATIEINHTTFRDTNDTLRFRVQPIPLDEITAFVRGKSAQFSALWEKKYDLGTDDDEGGAAPAAPKRPRGRPKKKS